MNEYTITWSTHEQGFNVETYMGYPVEDIVSDICFDIPAHDEVEIVIENEWGEIIAIANGNCHGYQIDFC